MIHKAVKIRQYRETEEGTDLVVTVEDKIGKLLCEKRIRTAEMRLDDGRSITADQRKKIYATVKDISEWTGYPPEAAKELLKYEHIIRTGSEYFSLSDCSMDTAREFINSIMDIALENGIPLKDSGVERTDDIGRYLYSCLKNRRCAVCGKDGEIHHEDAIGMGNDRRTMDDRWKRKICLCRTHHSIAHMLGVNRFRARYHIFGIYYEDGAEYKPEEEEKSGQSD